MNKDNNDNNNNNNIIIIIIIIITIIIIIIINKDLQLLKCSGRLMDAAVIVADNAPCLSWTCGEWCVFVCSVWEGWEWKKTGKIPPSGDLYCCWVTTTHQKLVTSWDPWNGQVLKPGTPRFLWSLTGTLDNGMQNWKLKQAEFQHLNCFKKWMVFQVSKGGFKHLFGRNCRILIMFWTAWSILTCWNTDVSTAEIRRCQLLLLPSVNQHGNEESTNKIPLAILKMVDFQWSPFLCDFIWRVIILYILFIIFV